MSLRKKTYALLIFFTLYTKQRFSYEQSANEVELSICFFAKYKPKEIVKTTVLN